MKEPILIEEDDIFEYPDFRQNVQLLRLRLRDVSEEHRPLLEKWIAKLSKIDTEMRHLERIESFSEALTTPIDQKEDD